MQSHFHFSKDLLEISWESYFPLKFSDSDFVDWIDFHTVEAFIQEHYHEIFSTSVFSSGAFTSSKRKYYEIAGDFFGFFVHSKLVGIFVGTPIDWSSYFFRNAALLSPYRGGQRYTRLLQHLSSILMAHGIERFEGVVSPTNTRHIEILSRLDFTITGVTLSERWGSLVHLTRFLNKTNAALFVNQFCTTLKDPHSKLNPVHLERRPT